jgi:hypothetical protein
MPMKEGDPLAPGDVVQIAPWLIDCFFPGCFMLVTEVKAWGAQGFIWMPQRRTIPPGQAYFRATWDQMQRIGRATWIPEPIPEAD